MNKHQKKYQDELRGIAPGLSDMEKRNAYTVPPGYFRRLPDRVMARIAQEQEKPAGATAWIDQLIGTVGHVMRAPRYALAIASVAAVVVVAVIVTTPAKTDAFALDVTTEEALAYVMNNIDAYESQDLMTIDPAMTLGDVQLDNLDNDEVDEALDLILDDVDAVELEEYF